MTTATKGLHWFRHDLRVHDNEALIELSQQTDGFIGVYVIDPSARQINQWGCSHVGQSRQTFIEQALGDLQQSLQSLGSDLMIVKGAPVEQLTLLLEELNITHLSYEMHAGYNERQQISEVRQYLQEHAAHSVEIIEGTSNYLYPHSELPFALANMPDTFSPFRKKAEKYATPRKALGLPGRVNNSPSAPIDIQSRFLASNFFKSDNARTPDANGYLGGESAALDRIEDYFFQTDRIAKYKETRNGLDGWDFSSRLSAYLAHGCISPSTVLNKLKQYEAERVANESTYWLFFELLWREFFHLQHIKHGHTFFQFSGIQGNQPSGRHDKHKFESWCTGNTGYEIVDACMRQLNATGFMSNRGRQLVASCFVHELNLDWRYGAAYFEQQLVDFDVASNWGNWQYLAGVGSDPRGHRQFNLQKQSDIYDPKRTFIEKWLNP